MDPAKPSLELLRSLTDEHVLRALIRHRLLTRAELAAGTGISKPTVGESVRRLTAAGLVVDTGQRTPGGRGRGRVGSYYALSEQVGIALAVSIAPGGIVAECVDAYGETVSRAQAPLGRPARSPQVAAALAATAAHARRAAGARVRLAVVSAADPVDRATGRLIQLPDAPFLVGELDPAGVLAAEVDGPVTVDNDVNWAARAERAASEQPLDDFAYVHLGEGLGCAIVGDGEIRRGRSGLAGEAAHLITVGPGGRATRLIEVFGELGLRQPGSTAIDVARLRAAAAADQEVRTALGHAVAGVLAAVVALADPQVVVLGGEWGTDPAVVEAIAAAAAALPRTVPVRTAALTAEPALAGARLDALDRLRRAITADATLSGATSG